jgi:uncharacterized protein YecT (DUF1311 family)
MKGTVVFVIVGALWGQTPQTDAFFAERGRLQAQAKAALDREMAGQKAGDCPNAMSTYDINTCLSKELETSTTNYKTYSGALRAILAQKNPYVNDNADLPPGPTGKPFTQAENVLNFDRAQDAWTKYRDAMCTGAAGLYRSGTAWHSQTLSCELMLLRSHLRELANSYGESLSH